ncbi:monofunctional biosynthetic peptidoglycan transglycosylase [Holophaga foetida]|uniref:monofunctional biosynthetic peptidoglycan transglycosylase n=1 Tax=Holophaga foetida TaxID=35839 RepID=UPI0002474D30|nr:monofunctional biosynthetic peptidoglycan transglycosylase [Holophaga foetida]
MAAKRGKGRQKPLGKRILKYSICAIFGWFALTFAMALFYRAVPVPYSALMVERELSSWFSGKPHEIHHDWVALDSIHPNMGLAVIAAEDQNFAEHFGFDWKAIEKAMAHNERSKRKRGASTLSQQTAKNIFLWESRSWVRKGFEVYFTLLIETTWSKKRILEVYLNSVEFGDGIYGVEAASQHFFRKPAKALRPSEAALLAAVLPSPRRYKANAPSSYVRMRQSWILNQMGNLGGAGYIKEL